MVLIVSAYDKIDFERYSRQIPMLRAMGQLKLAESTVAVVGLGGLGSLISFYLASAGVGRLILIDGEKVELNNLNRQILYDTSDIGLPKAVLAAKRLRSLNPIIDIEYRDTMISFDNVEELLEDADLIIDALDDWRARLVLDRYSQLSGKPLVHGAIDGFFGQMTTIVPGRTTCLACIAPKQLGPRGCRAALGAAVGIVAVLEALDAIKLLTGVGRTAENRLLIVDAFNSRIEEVELKPVDCSTCWSKFEDKL